MQINFFFTSSGCLFFVWKDSGGSVFGEKREKLPTEEEKRKFGGKSQMNHVLICFNTIWIWELKE